VDRRDPGDRFVEPRIAHDLVFITNPEDAPMKTFALVTTGLALLASSAAAQPGDAAALRPANEAYDLVRDLTTLFGPRVAGSPSEAAAAQWGADRLRRYGFNPVSVEFFPLRRWSPGETHIERLGIAGQPLVATALGGSVSGPAVEGEVMAFASYADFVASDPGIVRGRIVAVLDPVSRTSDGSGYLSHTEIRYRGAGEALKRGAVGFLMRSLSTSQDNVASSGATAPLPRPFPAFSLSPAAADQLARAVTAGQVRLRLRSTAGWGLEGRSQNVVATLPGSDPDASPIIIGAHLDSWEQGEGALDDGFGIGAVTLAAARLLQSGKMPQHTIKLVWFGAEEVTQESPDSPNFIGARAYLAAHGDQVREALFVAESDWGGGRILSVTVPTAIPAGTVDRLKSRLAPLFIPVRIGPPDPNVAEIGVLSQAGAPLVQLQQDATALFDIHHTPNDVLSRVDAAALEQNVEAWTIVLEVLSGAD